MQILQPDESSSLKAGKSSLAIPLFLLGRSERTVLLQVKRNTFILLYSWANKIYLRDRQVYGEQLRKLLHGVKSLSGKHVSILPRDGVTSIIARSDECFHAPCHNSIILILISAVIANMSVNGEQTVASRAYLLLAKPSGRESQAIK